MEVFVTLERGTSLYRARFQKPGEHLTTAKQLGPPLEHQAVQANRMSPAGIVMFYASDAPETALRETASDEGTFVVGRFETRRDAIILDFTQLPPIPTLFEEVPDSLEYNPRKVLSFLHHVTSAMSQPIARDDRVHINYVPTQIVTEYLRSRVLYEAVRVEGIRFPSAVDQNKASYVIFASQDNVSPVEDQPRYTFQSGTDRWLELVHSKAYEVKNDDLVRWRNEKYGIGYFNIGDPDTDTEV